MGKLPYYYYSDSDDAEINTSSAQNVKKKKLSSILNFKSSSKKKYNVQSKSEPDDSHRSSRSSSRSSVSTSRSRSRSNTVLKHKLRGILKHTQRESSDEDTDIEPSWVVRSQGRCLVGQVPRPPGAKPGRGGGLAFVIKRSDANKFPSQSIGSAKNRRAMKRLSQKRSY